MNEKSEKKIFDRAIGKRYNKKHIPVIDEESFFDDLRQLYPAAASITIVNLDRRDVDGKPHIISRNLRSIVLTHHYTNKRYISTSASWKDILAVIEGGMATINVSTKKV